MDILSKEFALTRKSVADLFLPRMIIWVPATCNLESALKVQLIRIDLLICKDYERK
jgi:hypothetical protein